MDMYEFTKNRLAFPPEELLQYRGKYIAWSPDGKRMIASDKDPLRLDDMVIALGYDPSEVVFSSVPDAEINLGGGAMGQRDCSETVRGPSFPGEREAIMDMCEFNKNRLAFPPDELLQYRGQSIAWSPDGARIIASHKDELRLDAIIRELGYDPAEILVSTVPDADIILGGGAMGE